MFWYLSEAPVLIALLAGRQVGVANVGSHDRGGASSRRLCHMTVEELI